MITIDELEKQIREIQAVAGHLQTRFYNVNPSSPSYEYWHGYGVALRDVLDLVLGPDDDGLSRLPVESPPVAMGG